MIRNRIVNLLFVLALCIPMGSCITGLDDVANKDGERKVVIFGRISTEEPPYEVRVSRSTPYTGSLNAVQDEVGALVILHTSNGDSEVLTEVEDGKYLTSENGIRGQVGESYYITVDLEDGTSYRSEEETITPEPKLTNIRYEFTSVERYSEEGVLIDVDGFMVYADVKDLPGEDLYLLDNKKVYQVTTNPELREEPHPYIPRRVVVIPPPCSGWVRDYSVFDLFAYKPKNPCTCCECWITEKGKSFKLIDDRLLDNNTLKDIEIAFVELGYEFLHDVYVEARLSKLSEDTYDYWYLLNQQINNEGTLFDTPPANIAGNIISDDPEAGQALGYFMATGVSSQGIFIDKYDIPYAIDVNYLVKEDCRLVFQNSTNIKPDYWP